MPLIGAALAYAAVQQDRDTHMTAKLKHRVHLAVHNFVNLQKTVMEAHMLKKSKNPAMTQTGDSGLEVEEKTGGLPRRPKARCNHRSVKPDHILVDKAVGDEAALWIGNGSRRYGRQLAVDNECGQLGTHSHKGYGPDG